MTQIKAYLLRSGYASQRKEPPAWYRDLTVAEAKLLSWHGSLHSVDRHGNVRDVRLNGKPKVWKRSPGCELSLKYGLRECFRVGDKFLEPHEAIGMDHQVKVIVPVRQQFEHDTPREVVLDWVLQYEVATQGVFNGS